VLSGRSQSLLTVSISDTLCVFGDRDHDSIYTMMLWANPCSTDRYSAYGMEMNGGTAQWWDLKQTVSRLAQCSRGLSRNSTNTRMALMLDIHRPQPSDMGPTPPLWICRPTARDNILESVFGVLGCL
jgi:hypothetical protein